MRESETILVVTRSYAPEPTGSGPVMQQLAEWLAGAGRRVKVVTVRPSYPERRITPGYAAGEHDRANEGGVSVRRMPTSVPQGSGLFARMIPEVRFFLDLVWQRAFGGTPPSAIVISLCPSIFTVWGACLLVRRGGRHVAVVHDIASGLGVALGMRAGSVPARMLRWLEAAVLNRSDHIVTLSQGMEHQLRQLGVTKPMTVLPPQVSTAQIFPRERPAAAPPTLIYSGNLGRKQGLDQLIDLAVVLERRAPDVRMIIRGQGAGGAAIMERARAENLSNVEFRPLASVDRLAEAMAEGDIHLVPQLPEGADFAVPSKVFAIMAAGRPLVATTVPGSALAKLAHESRALICVPPNDAEAFADAVITLLGNAEGRAIMGAAGRRYAEEFASTDVVMRQFASLLD